MLEISPLWETDARLGQVAAGGSHQPVGNEEATSDGDIWRIVGRDDFTGRLLVTCKSTPASDQSYDNVRTDSEGAISTKIAVLDLNTKTVNVLFTCHAWYDILQCSVDQNMQRLAFICRTVPCENVQIQNSSFDSAVHDVECEEIAYMCYWTLLNSSTQQLNSIHPLNKESLNFMKVQFLSLTQLLVFNPREAIYLYTLPSESDFSKAGLSRPVLYERLTGPFLWAEWNIPARQIFYLQLRCRPHPSHHLESSFPSADAAASVNAPACDLLPSLVGLQIHPGSPFETVLNIPLDILSPVRLDVTETVVETPNIHRNCGPFSNKIYDPSLQIDLSVFTESKGVVYICQGIAKEHFAGNDDPASIAESMSHSIDINIKYSVTVLHHGCTLHCTVQSQTLNNIVNQQILFVPLRSYVLVLMPGVFTHLLDVGMEHEPCNHILCFGCELPSIDVKEYAEFVTNVNSSGNEPLTYIMHSAETLKLFSVNVTSDSLLTAFQQQGSHSSSLNLVRQSILHHLVVHFDHFSNVEMALNDLVHDATHPQLVKLLQEFLVGGAFARAKGQGDMKAIDLLPVSVAEPFYPQQEMFLDDAVQMTITYAKLKDAASVLLSPNERHLPSRKMRDLWFRLWNHLRSSSAPATDLSKRFSSKPMRDRLLALGSPQVLRGKWPPTSPSASPFSFPIPLESLSLLAQKDCSNPDATFCNRFLGAAAEFRKSFGGAKHKLHKGSSSKESDADESNDRDDGYSQLEHVISLNLREITVHFSKNLPGETADVVSDAACNYVAHRLHQSQVLCHLLFQLLDVNPFEQTTDSHPFAFLKELPLTTAKELFMILERYFVAAKELVFPLPQGFEGFFSILAYKCMDIRTFLQYVDFGVVQLTSDVLDCITTDAIAATKTLSSTVADDDNVMLEIISRLSRRTAMNFLQNLSCSTSRLLRVHNIVDCYLHERKFLNSVEDKSVALTNSYAASEVENDCDAFDTLSVNVPSLILNAMASLIRHLQNHGNNLKGNSSTLNISTTSTSRSSSMSADLNLIKETQLNNIKEKSILSSSPYYMTIRPPISLWR